jgi:hypothetical protein
MKRRGYNPKLNGANGFGFGNEGSLCAVQNPQEATLSLVNLICSSLEVLWKDRPKNMMKVTALDHQGRFSFNGVCPHPACRRDSVFFPVTGAHSETIGNTQRGQPIARLAAVMQCQGCRKFILAIVTHVQNHNEYGYEEHYPLGSPNDSVSEDIPLDIRSDFREAMRCRWVDAYNATTEMCRRAIETSCIQLGAKPTDSIEAQIDWVHSQGKITTPLKDMAHKIRLGGNRGAHPSSRAITQEDADAVIEFTREYFDHVYVMPAKMAKFDFSKKALPPSA